MSESDIPNTGNAGEDPASRRRGHVHNFFEALKFINEASVAESVRQRFSDYVSIGLVVICVLSLIAAVALPVAPGLKLLPLVLTVAAVIFYMVNRMGIIVSMTARQALIVWQILIAAFWLGVTSSMLVMMSCIYFLGQGNIR